MRIKDLKDKLPFYFPMNLKFSNYLSNCGTTRLDSTSIISSGITTYNDSARHLNSYQFSPTNNATSYIIVYPSIGDDLVTLSVWCKNDKPSDGNKEMIVIDPNSGFYLGFSNSQIISSMGNFSNANYKFGEWNHIVIITSSSSLYLNSAELTAEDTNFIFYSTDIKTYIGGIPGEYYSGLMSDFRVYSTALTEDNILELYHTAAGIDSDNNIYTYEFIEAEKNNIDKQGIVYSDYIQEIDDSTVKIYSDKHLVANCFYEI